MNQPPIRYRAPRDDWNPQNPQGGGNDYVSERGSGGGGPFRKILIGVGAFFLLLVAVVVGASLFGGGEQTTKPKPVVIKSEKPKPLPSTWTRSYGVKLQFSGVPTEIRSVTVSGLNGNTANVNYVASGPCSGWIRKPASWLLYVPAKDNHPAYQQAAYRIAPTKANSRIGATCAYDISFHWPTKYTKDSLLTVRMDNGKRRSDNILLGLQVPESRVGVGV